jgi:hypothetical protein
MTNEGEKEEIVRSATANYERMKGFKRMDKARKEVAVE